MTVGEDGEMQPAFACGAFNDLARVFALVGPAPADNTGLHDAHPFRKLFLLLHISSDLFRRWAPQMRAMGSVGQAVSVFVKPTWHFSFTEIAPNL
jgi:hypothetical protein